jgi:hypothetical protein
MPLKKLQFKPGVNRENTRYTTEGGYYDCDKIRFRQGTPEKIGGWQQWSSNRFLGVCRSLWPWTTLAGLGHIGTGTSQKYYIGYSGAYYDITPVVATTAPGTITFSAVTVAPFSSTITVNHVGHNATAGTSVTYSGVTSPGGLGGNITEAVLEQEYQIDTVINANSYTIIAKNPSTGAPVTSNASDTGNGGAAVVGAYQVNAGPATQTPVVGWGTGPYGAGGWGTGSPFSESMRVWNHQNFGEDLIFGPKGGALYYWDATSGLSARGVALSSLSGASDVPTVHNLLIVSDTSRFVLAFGVNDYGSATQDTMLIRWSDQESAVNWTPAATNQAGSVRLSHGSSIIGVLQVRQEILVWTDTSLYSLQYLGPPVVWGSQLLSDNISVLSDRAMAVAAGATYWMGAEKFYVYDGRVQTLPCDVRQYIFSDFNYSQLEQVFASTVEQFNEIWWFYCSTDSTAPDRYVVFNYLERAWYYGTMERTAWIDASVVSDVPIAAYSNRLIVQETGVDDSSSGSPTPITAYITSAEFDIDDGHNFGFIWRILPDVTFRGSSAAAPSALMTLLPLQNSGSGYTRGGDVTVASVTDDMSVAGSNALPVTRVSTVPIEQFTGQINVRVRGRQMAFKVSSDGLGVQWQLGSPRIDVRQDGRKS